MDRRGSLTMTQALTMASTGSPKNPAPGDAHVSEQDEKRMDTDYLTPMTYDIIANAGMIMDKLRLEIASSCSKYKTEDSFLNGTLKFINKNIDDPEDFLDYWNYIDEINIEEFKNKLKKLRKKILLVINTPISDRCEPPFK
jgi:hypothetical protein